jgi:uncharacterized protein YbaR (Trm112 family)
MKDLLDLLCCPESGQALQPAPPDLIKRLNMQRAAGTLRNRAGDMPAPFESALMTLDGSRIYPVRDGIPVLLIPEIL